MKKLLFITAISILLPLTISANPKEEIEEAIDNSRPQKLEQLLEIISLTDLQKEAYLTFADKILEFRKNQIAGIDRPESEYIALGIVTLYLGCLALIPHAGTSLINSIQNKSGFFEEFIKLRYKRIPAVPFALSFVFFFLAHREKHKPIERSRRDKYMDALRVKEILTKLIDHKGSV